MSNRKGSLVDAALPAGIFYVLSRSLKAAGADPTFVWMCELAAMLFGFLMVFRLLGEIKNSINLRKMLKPKGINGWLGEVNSFHPKAMGLHTDNNDGNGLLLGSLKRKWLYDIPVFYKGDSHGLILAGTGAGKTSSLSKGWVVGLGKHHNRIVTAKGADIAVSTYRFLTEELNHHVVCIDPYRLMREHGIESDDFNVCDILVKLADERSPDILDKAREIALVLIPEQISSSGENKIFRNVGRSIIYNILVYLAVEQASTGEFCCNLAYLNRLINSGTQDVLKVFQRMSIMPEYEGAIARAGKRFISQFANNPKSAASFLTEAQEALVIFEPVTPIGKSCESSTFLASDLKNPNKPMTVFIILPPEKSGLNDAFAGLCLNSLCTTAIEADRFTPQVTIIADEFENLSSAPLPTIEKVLKIGRTRGVRLLAMCQDGESLKARYGQMSSMFWTQSSLKIAMDIRSVNEAEDYSKRSGQRSVITDSASVQNNTDEHGVSIKEESIPLLRQDEFIRLPKFTAAVWKDNNPPLILDLVHYKMVDPWMHQIDDVPNAPPEPNLPIKFKFKSALTRPTSWFREQATRYFDI